MTRAWTSLAGAAVIALVSPAMAQQPASPSVPPRYALPSTTVWDMTSDHGEIYCIFISFPEGEPPAEGYPVLYVLDGNALFAAFAETRRMLEWTDAGKAIVVGVGYPTDKAYDARRINDLTGAPTDSPAYARFAKEPSGGWDRFLDFLTGELRSELGKRHRINLDRQALFGHSLGGSFALHTLFTRPDAFHAIIAASPSLFWHERLTTKEERDFTTRLQTGKVAKVGRLLVVAGEREETVLERWDPEAFVKRMEPLSAYGLRIRSEMFAGEGHMTVPVRAVPSTLRFAFSWP